MRMHARARVDRAWMRTRKCAKMCLARLQPVQVADPESTREASKSKGQEKVTSVRGAAMLHCLAAKASVSFKVKWGLLVRIFHHLAAIGLIPNELDWASLVAFIALPVPPDSAAIDCQRLGIQAVKLFCIKDACRDWDAHHVGLELDLYELLDLCRLQCGDLDCYPCGHARCQGLWVILHADKVALHGDDVEPCDIDVKVPQEDDHAIHGAHAQGSEAACSRSHFDQLLAVTKSLHGTRELPMLLGPTGNSQVLEDFRGTDLRSAAYGVGARLPHCVDTGRLRCVLLVRDTRGADSAVCGPFHFDIVRVDLHACLAHGWPCRPWLSIDVPRGAFLVGVRTSRRLVRLRKDWAPPCGSEGLLTVPCGGSARWGLHELHMARLQGWRRCLRLRIRVCVW
mmetsp:Transcript_2353/g.5409  ORF Transcript_2353/g.5409 Transcript_2353/m.5409 type:complete len:397 (+) Transcript_2353:88-1278(+)